MKGPQYGFIISLSLEKNMGAVGNYNLLLSEIKKTNSSLELGRTMNCYLVGMMYGRSCLKFPYFVPIVQLKWPVLVCDWQIKKMFSKTISPN